MVVINDITTFVYERTSPMNKRNFVYHHNRLWQLAIPNLEQTKASQTMDVSSCVKLVTARFGVFV